jgi:manganese-dependent inorganic pyrophosphatase
VEVGNLHELTNRLPEITSGLEDLAQSRGLGLAVLMVTDVVRGSSRLVLAGPAVSRLDDLPYERLPDGTLHARDVVSRKKQLLPAILGLVS